MKTENMEREAIMAESDAQNAYESFLKNTNDSIKAAQKALVIRAVLMTQGGMVVKR